jgi:hypothetical protein
MAKDLPAACSWLNVPSSRAISPSLIPSSLGTPDLVVLRYSNSDGVRIGDRDDAFHNEW